MKVGSLLDVRWILISYLSFCFTCNRISVIHVVTRLQAGRLRIGGLISDSSSVFA